MKRNKTPLSRYFKNYKTQFSKPIDDVWEKFDADQNGFLDKDEAKKFLDEISKIIDEERGKYYNKDNFETLFEEYDEDNNGYLSKSEMAQFIKMNFKPPKNDQNVIKIKNLRGQNQTE